MIVSMPNVFSPSVFFTFDIFTDAEVNFDYQTISEGQNTAQYVKISNQMLSTAYTCFAKKMSGSYITAKIVEKQTVFVTFKE